MNLHKWAIQKEIWSQPQKCARCKVIFCELQNIGKWECGFHPGIRKSLKPSSSRSAFDEFGILVEVPCAQWSCCDRLVNPIHDNGCTPCDHTFSKIIVTEQDTLVGVKPEWIAELKCKPESIIQKVKHDALLIKRGRY